VSPAPRGHVLGLIRTFSPGALVFAATVPILFLHVDYQPAAGLPAGVTFKLSDAMVLLTAACALGAARHGGLQRLRAGVPVWTTALLFLAWIVLACFYPLLADRPYAFRRHFVTAGEFAEYALLAPAVPLLLRRARDRLLVLGVAVAWTAVATAVAVVQWAGWEGLSGWGRGHRQPSFIGTHDLAALCGFTLGIGIVALLWRARGRLRTAAWVALGCGAVGFVLGGAVAGVFGLVPATLVAVVVAARRGLLGRRTVIACVAATAVASLGVVTLRAGDFGQFFRFLGVRQTEASTRQNVQTYSHRTLLAYIGVRIWVHHPVVGVGWQGSSDPAAFGPELPAAHRRFPDVTAKAFPSPAHRYGVQMLYLQALADLGLIGFALLVGLFAAAALVGLRRALRAPPAPAFAATLGLFGLLLGAGLWSAEGLVAGTPLDALTWLTLGLVCVPADA
jgi:hypothetical protein